MTQTSNYSCDYDDRLIEMLNSALGPDVGKLLRDPQVSEIRINPDGHLWENRLGVGKRFSGQVIAADRVKSAIYTVAFSVGAVCNEQTPSLAAELPGSGARFQALHPPVVARPIIAIRKKATKIFTLDDLQAQGILSEAQKEIIIKTTLARENILVVGGTDSGKTTFTNAILQIISKTKASTV